MLSMVWRTVRKVIFSELYSAYYNTVARIVAAAIKYPPDKGDLRKIIEKNAFGESILAIEPAIEGGRWQLIHADGSTPIKHTPTMPLTLTEKRWLAAIASDPRIRLFSDEKTDLSEVEPLFGADDIYVFDKYSDGDPYENRTYIKNFRLILDAVKNRYPLSIDSKSRKGTVTHIVLMPEYLEYSEKDDKFRLIGLGRKNEITINLAGIVRCKPYKKLFTVTLDEKKRPKTKTVEFEIADRRNALERVLMHFAHFEKQAERTAEDKYRVTVSYDKDDETEIVIRLLSFGPMVKVTSPQRFVELIKERLMKQKSWEH